MELRTLAMLLTARCASNILISRSLSFHSCVHLVRGYFLDTCAQRITPQITPHTVYNKLNVASLSLAPPSSVTETVDMGSQLWRVTAPGSTFHSKYVRETGSTSFVPSQCHDDSLILEAGGRDNVRRIRTEWVGCRSCCLQISLTATELIHRQQTVRIIPHHLNRHRLTWRFSFHLTTGG